MTESEKNKIKYRLEKKIIKIKGLNYVLYEEMVQTIKEVYEESFNIEK